MVDIPEVRRRVRAAIEKARHVAAERRERTDAAARDYETFLTGRAVPVFHQFAAALKGEGYAFTVFTPASAVRLAADRSPQEFIELTLDSTSDPPAVVGRTVKGRGRRVISAERALSESTPIGELTDEDVLAFLLEEITSLIER